MTSPRQWEEATHGGIDQEHSESSNSPITGLQDVIPKPNEVWARSELGMAGVEEKTKNKNIKKQTSELFSINSDNKMHLSDRWTLMQNKHQH